jgi:hypothetical protein
MTNRHKIVSAIMGLAAMAASPAWAQLPIPGTGPVPVTSIPPYDPTSNFGITAFADADMDTKQFPPVVASLTTTTNAPQYVPNPPPLNTISDQIGTGVNGQNVNELLPVTQGLPCDSYDHMLKVASALQQTYLSVMATTQGLANQLQGENLAQIAANVQAPAELAATQGVGQAVLALMQEVRMERAQLAALTMIVAVDRLHELDANVRAKMPRQGQGCQ